MILNLRRVCALQNGDKWILSEDTKSTSRRSPLLNLFEWIYVKYPQDSRKLLRQKVLLASKPTPFESGLIKTLGKRWRIASQDEMNAIRHLSGTELVEPEKLFHPIEASTEKFTVSSWLEAARMVDAWVDDRRRKIENTKRPRHEQDRPIVAALFDQNGQLIVRTFNTNGQIRTRHAEMNLLEYLNCDRLPEDAVLIVSTQCCRMCAGAIAERLPLSSRFKVYYLEPEPKLKNVRTALFGVEEQLQRTR